MPRSERPAMPDRYYNPNDPTEREPFGRQPKPVRVILEGDPIDVRYWMLELTTRAEFKGADVSQTAKSFTIYPRAVNE